MYITHKVQCSLQPTLDVFVNATGKNVPSSTIYKRYPTIIGNGDKRSGFFNLKGTAGEERCDKD